LLEPVTDVDVWTIWLSREHARLDCRHKGTPQECYHLGLGKHVTRRNLSKVNINRDYLIFEEHAYYLVSEDRRKGQLTSSSLTATSVLLIPQPSRYALMCSGKHKGGIKIHTLYDMEPQIPVFFHITTTSVHDSKAMR